MESTEAQGSEGKREGAGEQREAAKKDKLGEERSLLLPLGQLLFLIH